jgi:hypothetical protein
VTHWNELLLTLMESPPLKAALTARLPSPPSPPSHPSNPPVPPGVKVVDSGAVFCRCRFC